jgi:Formate--tetrahydrofolate ligase
MKSSLEIAQGAEPAPIEQIAARCGLEPDELEPYGRDKAKVSLSVIERLAGVADGRLVCVAGMTPTKGGEGKTTSAIGLTQGLGAIGRAPVLCLREPSLGPVFGVKGGGAGGGLSQVVPMEDVNLHFTGDIHAIGAANNLLAAMLDASILHGNPHEIDPLRIGWRRAVDMNDRALRQVAIGLGGRANGYPRESGFDITAASEVMAILAVARDLADLRRRLGAITAAYSHDGAAVTAEDLGAAGPMTVLLKQALKPNLIQTLEGQPCLMHTGPFANIAHGNSSLVADLVGLKLGEYVVTESGFGSDMGMEKFFDIVCRVGGLAPSAVVLVVTVRALAHHGGLQEDSGVNHAGARDPGAAPDDRVAAIEAGVANLRRHLGVMGLLLDLFAACADVRRELVVNDQVADPGVVICLVQADALWLLRGRLGPLDRDRVERALQQLVVVAVRAVVIEPDRDPRTLREDRTLRPPLARSVGFGPVFAPPKGALVIAPSADRNDQSIPITSSYSKSPWRQISWNTPACSHSWKRRCAEDEEHTPVTFSAFHCIPVRSTSMIASIASRSGTRGA